MSETIDWTTVALSQEQKATLEATKPDELGWGEWIMALAGENDVGGIDEEALREVVEDALEAGEAERNARVLTQGLMQRLQDMDEVVRESAYEGAKEAMEE